MDNPSWIAVMCLAIMVAALLVLINVRAWFRRRSGLSCDRCFHYEKIRGEELCGSSMGLEPVPWTRTCSRFHRAGR